MPWKILKRSQNVLTSIISGRRYSSVKIHRGLGDLRGQGTALTNLGVAHKKSGSLGRAIEYYEEALPALREIGDRRGEGDVLWNIALALNDLGQRAKAIECAGMALRIREQIEDPRADKVRSRLHKWRTTPDRTKHPKG
jgi:tetratricopeptide (TPR) repeat protein